jgi:hypothetical protein
VQNLSGHDAASKMNGAVESSESIRRPASEDKRGPQRGQNVSLAIQRASPPG